MRLIAKEEGKNFMNPSVPWNQLLKINLLLNRFGSDSTLPMHNVLVGPGNEK